MNRTPYTAPACRNGEHGITPLWPGEPIADDDFAPRCPCDCQDASTPDRP
ncbi:hypothetical protein ACIOGX_20040 [Streptomyces sp. NPDC088147]